MVVGVDPDAKEDLLVQVSVAASVPFVSKAQPLDAPTGQPDGTIDAVVTTGALGRVDDPEAIVREAGRVLKPGAPLVFVEDLSWGRDEPLAALTSSNAAAELFEPAQYDDGWATLPLAGVAIGVAVRKGGDDAGGIRGRRGQTLEGRFRDSVGAQREAREAKEEVTDSIRCDIIQSSRAPPSVVSFARDVEPALDLGRRRRVSTPSAPSPPPSPPNTPAARSLSTMDVLVPSRTIFFSTKGLFPRAMSHLGHALDAFPGCTTLTIHSWQNVCRHSI